MCLVAVFIAGILPQGTQPGLHYMDKLVHFAVFAGLAAISGLAITRDAEIALAAAVLLTVGLAIELAQARVPGRFASAADFIADGVGVAAGFYGVARIRGAIFDTLRRDSG